MAGRKHPSICPKTRATQKFFTNSSLLICQWCLTAQCVSSKLFHSAFSHLTQVGIDLLNNEIWLSYCEDWVNIQKAAAVTLLKNFALSNALPVYVLRQHFSYSTMFGSVESTLTSQSPYQNCYICTVPDFLLPNKFFLNNVLRSACSIVDSNGCFNALPACSLSM